MLNKKYFFLSFTLLLIGTLFASFFPHTKPSSKAPQAIKTLVIDAGHGGKDPGALGNGFKEKDITLKIALELKRIVNENMPNIKVIMTRSTDKFVPLSTRGEIAQNNNADFFISLHCNSIPKGTKSPHGTEIYVLGTNPGQERYETSIKENEVIAFEDNYQEMYGGFDPKSPEGGIFHNLMKNAFRNESLNLAGKIDKQFKERAGRKSYGVKQAPFIVLWQSGVPAVLIETGYISDKSEALFLASAEGQTLLASAIYRSLKEYNQELGAK